MHGVHREDGAGLASGSRQRLILDCSSSAHESGLRWREPSGGDACRGKEPQKHHCIVPTGECTGSERPLEARTLSDQHDLAA